MEGGFRWLEKMTTATIRPLLSCHLVGVREGF